MNANRFDKFAQHLSHFLWSVQRHMDSLSSDRDKRQSLKQDFDLLGKGFNWFLNENTKGDMPAFQLTTKGDSTMLQKSGFEAEFDRKLAAFRLLICSTKKMDAGAADQLETIDHGLAALRATLVDLLGLKEQQKPADQTTGKTEASDAPASSWNTIRKAHNVTGIDPAGRSLKSNDDAWASITAEPQSHITIDDSATTKGEDGSSWDCLRRVVNSGVEVM